MTTNRLISSVQCNRMHPLSILHKDLHIDDSEELNDKIMLENTIQDYYLDVNGVQLSQENLCTCIHYCMI